MLDLPVRISDSLLSLIEGQRQVAHLVIDEEQRLMQAGGHLDHYGLAGLEFGLSASDQIPLLEGMLPLAETPFLIRSMAMPSGRVADVHFFADDGTVWVLLLDVTAEHDEAQLVQQKAYDMTLLSQREARLIAQLEAANEELTRAHRELAESQERLRDELRDAERYVRAVLPAPMTEPFVVDWRFVPSTELGGDSFGYHWVDKDHFAIYLIDVCGHGVGSALLTVAVGNTLRSEALPGVDFRHPAQVLAALNEAYQMERHAELFSTVWYGVYQPGEKLLRYATAGHPSPVLVSGAADGPCDAKALEGKGACIGLSPFARYAEMQCALQSPARLFVFSDGAYEIGRPDGSMLGLQDLARTVAQPVATGRCELDAVLEMARQAHGPGALQDDFTILKLAI